MKEIVVSGEQLKNDSNEKTILVSESRDWENLSSGTTVPGKVRDPGIPGLEGIVRTHFYESNSKINFQKKKNYF
jgi:hypothetical protein